MSESAEFGALRAWLARVPTVRVVQVPVVPGPGEQGAWDVLAVLASGTGALAVAMRSLPDFVRSRRSSVTVTIRVADDEVTLTATNVEDAVPVIESLVGKLPDDDEPS
ncbi:effector-associated constant component EACC1 [Streptomyces sp. CBMA156]|uniref:effector-associated constant component EACC1 n=1 Tax=Streptomyces sp. CBMA156 TaxID=1930280 RepID=UPI001661EB0A|nr:hypothetical protein [Streptomyces sp. CBMA156]